MRAHREGRFTGRQVTAMVIAIVASAAVVLGPTAADAIQAFSRVAIYDPATDHDASVSREGALATTVSGPVSAPPVAPTRPFALHDTVMGGQSTEYSTPTIASPVAVTSIIVSNVSSASQNLFVNVGCATSSWSSSSPLGSWQVPAKETRQLTFSTPLIATGTALCPSGSTFKGFTFGATPQPGQGAAINYTISGFYL